MPNGTQPDPSVSADPQIAVYNSDGVLGTIPRSQTALALANGYKMKSSFVEAVHPQTGQTGIIPKEQWSAAQAQGFTLSPREQATQQLQQGLASQVNVEAARQMARDRGQPFGPADEDRVRAQMQQRFQGGAPQVPYARYQGGLTPQQALQPWTPPQGGMLSANVSPQMPKNMTPLQQQQRYEKGASMEVPGQVAAAMTTGGLNLMPKYAPGMGTLEKIITGANRAIVAGAQVGTGEAAGGDPRKAGEAAKYAAILQPLGDFISARFPSRKEAGDTINDVKNDIGSNPVDTSQTRTAAQRANQLRTQVGAFMPAPLRKYVTRINDQTQGPLTFAEARDFYSQLTKLSLPERLKTGGEMKALVNEVTARLGGALESAANQAGRWDYGDAVRNYSLAMRNRVALSTAAALGAAAYTPWGKKVLAAAKLLIP